MLCVLGCNCAVGISFLQSFHVRSRGSLLCWDQSTEVAQNMGHALSPQHVTHFTFWALIFRSSRLLSLRRNQKDLKIRQERSPLLKLLQDWTQVKCCARMSGIVWVCKQVASGAALVGSCFQLREGKKLWKQAYIRVILPATFWPLSRLPNNARNSAIDFLEEKNTCVIMLGFYRQIF